MDGTFDVMSLIYTQLFTIHGVTDDGWTFPLVYAFLPNKQESSYKYVLKELSDNRRGWMLSPDIIITDYERAMINAAEECFPTAVLQGCHFHFKQALYRNMSTNLKNTFLNDMKFSKITRKLFSIPFVHPDHVHVAFQLVVASNDYKGPLKNELDEFLSYFKRTYIGTNYTPALYNPRLWSVHQRVLDNIPRTNNSVEAWNRRIQVIAESSHIPFYKLIDLIKGELKVTNVSILQRQAGERPPNRKAAQKDLDRRIFLLVSNYEKTELADFIDGMSSNMTLSRHKKLRTKYGGEILVEHEGSGEETDEEIEVVESNPPKRQRLTIPINHTTEESNLPTQSSNTFAPQYSTAPVLKRKTRGRTTN